MTSKPISVKISLAPVVTWVTDIRSLAERLDAAVSSGHATLKAIDAFMSSRQPLPREAAHRLITVILAAEHDGSEARVTIRLGDLLNRIAESIDGRPADLQQLAGCLAYLAS
jgi:hypothetical protein